MRHSLTLQKISNERISIKSEPKRIQPLFKKKFSPIQSPLSINNPNTNLCDKKLINSEIDHQRIESKHLYNEKLGIIRDLLSYSAKYDSHYSMRARFLKILNLIQNLEELIDASTEQITTEERFHKRLNDSMQEIEKVVVYQKETKEFLLEEDELELKLCTNISGVYCMAFISYNKSMNNYYIKIYGENNSIAYSYHLNLFIKSSIQELPEKISVHILDKMHFCMDNNQLSLKYSDVYLNEEILVVKLRGINNETCVKVTEKGKMFELSMENSSICINKQQLKISNIKELRISGRRQLVKNLLESNLSFINYEIGWGLSDWEVLKKTKIQIVSGIFRKISEINVNTLEEYEKIVHKDEIILLMNNLKITLYVNTILEKIRILVELDNFSIKIHEECYPKEFKFLKQLQKYSICSATIVKSVEFAHFLKGILFN